MTSSLIRSSFTNKPANMAGLFFWAYGDNSMMKGSAEVETDRLYRCPAFFLTFFVIDDEVVDYDFFSTCTR
jgi:hypothetical protein